MEGKVRKEEAVDFLTKTVMEDVENETYSRPIATRFPPEPNGYLHIGSAYAIHVNAAIAEAFHGKMNLRFDDTNPLKEDMKYVEAIREDVRWLGLDLPVYFGSDYSEEIFEAALKLIRKGKAYVCDLSAEEMTEYRGTLTEPGKNSPYRERSVEDNLSLFHQMKEGRFPDGAKVLRAKIDMSSPNINLRDPVLYRIIHAEHYRTGSEWCVYPMYDFAHPIQDAIEGITHSLCSAEFRDHRPLYEWVLRELEVAEPPKQREFGRLNVSGMVTSKRYIRELVEGGFVDGWDDPRLPTLKGLRRRGVTPEGLRRFMQEVGMLRGSSTVDDAMLDHFIRQDLKDKSVAVMAVLNPLKVIITNYPKDQVEMLHLNHSDADPMLGGRDVPFSGELYIEREDFMEHPVPGFHRLFPGGEARLKGAYYVKCHHAVKDPETGEVKELHCTYDPETKSGTGFSGRKVKSTIHWVSAAHGVPAEIRLYGSLLKDAASVAESDNDWAELVSPDSRIIFRQAIMEPWMKNASPDAKYQFIRQGYFCLDHKDQTGPVPIFNRIVSLKDSWKRGASR
ncbi:glutamine--tRNA ligase/YqeY domain fusion protein [Paenibacillus cellulositrophicus]|uniref:glutamine--tRNA ligase/YqeY domain fusion protein n=1 Tax=Paenibacillus cellulositrophicus TaxID=562959 RepID=UPI00203F51E7|nr:glutamine--tRNA ligase/YqeY domain fusion protein [Paenibacillus cellulositrophicus]MCM2997947.1 glutamine--tRNA ligase/YqeY domain fusion protein [Paenibacillus cellulositrophicus]